ncbi:hypothetical protein PS619_04646 [Pseudomonas fluorescens]|uniref:Uncharacterized protein n=1 Tax=Pseudomonas tensinigenes TaxID=2745511 RepID=A0ABX8PWU1_9PSED|nr:hypothetical protein [Pseudomonas tensinigenes]QXI05813.1 hypothetical protein HU718_028035 [Pseudomonas tensinigenes]VVM77201.1 hypothetical protein PS681_02094 [Pseudomonas fluorescens]VVN27508.1 hypothetical protein PS619_04646 [Pseudomonas fluorescens]VVN51614.1 hypothetical protein PS684_00729 [Pseudomonas fluorescens]
MKLKVVTGLVISLNMMSATYAATCPTISVSRSQDAEDLSFTSALVKDKNTSKSVVICRYEGKNDLGVSAGYRNGTPISTTGTGWTGNECTAADGDVNKCAFQGKKK